MSDAELIAEVVAWIKRRNALSADCQRLGIGSSSADTPKWADELCRREQPLRDAAERYVTERGLWR